MMKKHGGAEHDIACQWWITAKAKEKKVVFFAVSYIKQQSQERCCWNEKAESDILEEGELQLAVITWNDHYRTAVTIATPLWKEVQWDASNHLY